MNDLIGKPYKLGAAGPDAFDCWTLVVEVAKRRGVIVPELNCEGFKQVEIVDLASRLRYDIAEETCQPADGDVLLSLRLAHIGTVFGDMVLHTHRRHGVILEKLGSFLRTYRDAKAYRWIAS